MPGRVGRYPALLLPQRLPGRDLNQNIPPETVYKSLILLVPVAGIEPATY
jgi:hypothetical protein